VDNLARFYGPTPDPKQTQAPKRQPRNEAKAREWKAWRYRDVLIELRARGAIDWQAMGIGVVLSSFANANSGGKCFPSIEAIAQRAGLKVDDRRQCRVISRALAQLKKAGAIEIERQFNGPNVYLLKGEVLDSNSPVHLDSLVPANMTIQQDHSHVRKPIILTEAMKARAAKKIPAADLQAEFEKMLAYYQDRKPITSQKSAARAWSMWVADKFNDAKDEYGHPVWTEALWDTARRSGKFADERTAQRHFARTLAKSLRKNKPVNSVKPWWGAVVRNYEPEER
jgi:hypothetical protein